MLKLVMGRTITNWVYSAIELTRGFVQIAYSQINVFRCTCLKPRRQTSSWSSLGITTSTVGATTPLQLQQNF